MLLGSRKPKGPATGAGAGAGQGTGAPGGMPGMSFGGGGAMQGAAMPVIFDVGTEDFEDKVMRMSMRVPVLVDFWAPWCGPCKQLGPVLEAAVQAANGQVLMAKVNIDENPELAQALRIQSVPTVYAFFGGQPVNAFAGLRPPAEIKAFIEQLVRAAKQNQPDALDIPQVLAQAAQALAAGDAQTAQALYMAILEQDEANVQAFTGMVRTLIAAGVPDQARMMVEQAPDNIAKDPQFSAARTALELAENAPAGSLSALQAASDADPANHQARFDLAGALFAAGRKEEAIDALIDIMRRPGGRAWEEEKARKELLKFFDALGPSDPDTLAGRRKLSSVLFS